MTAWSDFAHNEASFKSARESLQAVKEDRPVLNNAMYKKVCILCDHQAAGDELARCEDAGPLRPTGDSRQ